MKDWIGSLALRAYPQAFRAARGEEMLGALLDAGEDSTRAFIWGVVSLVFNGLLERARENARIGTRRLVADAFCLAAVLWTLLELRQVTHLLTPAPIWILMLLAAVLVFAALGRDRLGALCGLIVVGYALFGASSARRGGPVLLGPDAVGFFIDAWLGPTVCFIVMLFAPRTRTSNSRGLIWLALVAALLLMPETPAFLLLLVGVPAVGIILLPVDPRLAIASAVLWADISIDAQFTIGRTQVSHITLLIVLLAVVLAVARNGALSRRMHA